MSFSKYRIIRIALTAALILGGIFFWLHYRETPEKAVQRLAAQNIEVTEDNFFAAIRAGHMDNIHNFLLAAGEPGTLDPKGTGISALMVAVKTGKRDVVASLLAALPDDRAAAMRIINLQEAQEGKTALIMAAEEGYTDIAADLLARGADTAVTDKRQETPLLVGVRRGHSTLLPLLIAADVKQHRGAAVNVFDAGGETPLTYAIRARNKDMVEVLMKAGADAVSADRSGVSPLMVAAQAGDETIGAMLIAAGAQIEAADRLGNSPLSLAIRNAHPGFVKLLIEKGASADFHTSGPPPLQLAITLEPFNLELFAYLLEHSKLSGNLDASLLFDAIDRKNAALAKILLEHGISAKATNAKGESLLARAIENGLEDLALALIDKGAEASPNINALLEKAAKRNEAKLVQKLLTLGAFADQKIAEGYTLAEMAVYSGYPDVLDALMAKGAKLDKEFCILWSIRDGGGKAVPVLLKYGARADVRSNTEDSALGLAAAAGETEAVAALIKSRAALDYPNTAQGMTPLALASHAGKLETVKLLAEAGAKLEAADASGMTPLAHAAYMAKPDVVEYLIGKGANSRAADKQGRSVSDLAALAPGSQARDKVMALLQKK